MTNDKNALRQQALDELNNFTFSDGAAPVCVWVNKYKDLLCELLKVSPTTTTDEEKLTRIREMGLPDSALKLVQNDHDALLAFAETLRSAALNPKADAPVHPWYGECDRLGPGGQCAECLKLDAPEAIEELDEAIKSAERYLADKTSIYSPVYLYALCKAARRYRATQDVGKIAGPAFVVELPPMTESAKYKIPMAMMPLDSWERIAAAISGKGGVG